METKDYMIAFLREGTPTTFIEEVLDIKVKDFGDVHGDAAEHYVVTVKVRVSDFSFTSGEVTKTIETKCLVNRKQFNHFVEKHKAIIWL